MGLETFLVISIIFGIFVGCVVVLNIYFIVTKDSLYAPMYYLLIQVGIAEIIFHVNNITMYAYWKFNKVNITFTGTQNEYGFSPVFIFISQITYVVSVCTLMLMSVDRFIAIKYCLHYHRIVTKLKVAIVSMLTWMLSIGLRSITFLYCRSVDLRLVLPRRKIDFGQVMWSILILFCMVMLALTKYAKKIRHDHTSNIIRRQKYFGIQAQKLTILRRLKQSLRDTLCLNYVGLGFVLLNFLCHMLFNYIDDWFYNPLSLLVIIYMTLNPIIFTYAMTEMRKAHVKSLKKLFPCLKGNTVGVVDTRTPYNGRRAMSTQICEFDMSTHYIGSDNRLNLNDSRKLQE